MKVVRPEWLVRSVEAGTLLPWRDFMFRTEDRSEGDHQGRKTTQQLLPIATPAPIPKIPDALPVEQTGSSPSTAGPSNTTGDPTERQTTPPSMPKTAHEALRSPSVPKTPARPLYTTDPLTAEQEARVPGYAAHESNPNAQKVMQNPEWRAAHTSIAPDFIEGYYKNSRLHHLSTWKAELKNLVTEAQERAEAAVDGSTQHGDTAPAEGPSGDAGVSMRGAELILPVNFKGKGKEKAIESMDQVIMHCDFDCFFVAAGLVSRPHLKGKPVVVCHSQGGTGGGSSTSEIASANYESRKFGIKNGMSLQQARKLCPTVITIPYEFERYESPEC